MNNQNLIELHADGTSLIVELSGRSLSILHWGAEVGPGSQDLITATIDPVPHADLDEPIRPGLWRVNATGFLGRPAILGHRAGQDWSQTFEISSVEQSGNSIRVSAEDLSLIHI